MPRFFAFLLAVGALGLAGQNAPPVAAGQAASEAVPPETDQALRDRVTRFYQAHVDGKYRQAEQYVAEESKDLYYAAQKPHYLKFEIKSIDYSDHFTKAKVATLCDQEVRHPAMGSMPMTFLVKSDWKFENGLWVFVVPTVSHTPFGDVRRSQSGEGAAATGGPARPNPKELLKTVTSAVRADKAEVRLSSPDATESVLLTNTMPGTVTLGVQLPSQKPGFAAWLERERLGPKETCRVLFRLGEPVTVLRRPAVVTVRVEPTGQTIPIRVTFALTK